MERKTGILRLLEIASERKTLLFFACVFSAASALCVITPFWAIYEILKELLRHASHLSEVDAYGIIKWGWIAFIGLVIGSVLLYIGIMLSHIAAFRILYGLKIRMSEHFGKLSLGYIHTVPVGGIKKMMEQSVERIEHFVAHTIPDLVNVFATIVFMFIVFFSVEGWMAFIALLCICVSVGFQFSNFAGKNARDLTKTYFDVQDRLAASAVQYVNGMPIIKIFGRSIGSFQQFNAEIEAYKLFALKCCSSYKNGTVYFLTLLNSIITFILPVGLLLLNSNSQNISIATAFLFFVIMGPGVVSPIYRLAFLSSATVEINEGVRRIDDFFCERPLKDSFNQRLPKRFEIEFSKVSFAYTHEGDRVLDNVSFIARQGEITALVGSSGSGKTTIANLISRFWDIDSGKILIGGTDIRDIPISCLYEFVSFVFQDRFLFQDSIFENIVMGTKETSLDAVKEAAKAAQCHEFIQKLKDGYDTVIGEGGATLSGGEAQRICIARAIFRNSPILVLDEATAFADSENEYKIKQALQKLTEGKTVIMIAHRLSSITSANQIIVLDKGKIAQKGVHDDLYSAAGQYQNLWNAYMSAHEWKLQIK